MPTYTTDAYLIQLFPDPLPAFLTSARRVAAISRASGVIDGMVGTRFPYDYANGTQKFPNVSDSPTTPALIQEAATLWAGSICWGQMYQTTTMSREGTSEDKALREQVTNKDGTGIIDKILSGEYSVGVGGTDIDLDWGVISSETGAVASVRLGRYDDQGSLIETYPGTLDNY